MNTQSTVQADTSTHPLEAVCQAIVQGNYDLLPAVDVSDYSDEEWQREAQSALDCEDFSEIAAMIERDAAYADYEADMVDWDRCWQFGAEKPDFDDWFDRNRARPAETTFLMGGVA